LDSLSVGLHNTVNLNKLLSDILAPAVRDMPDEQDDNLPMVRTRLHAAERRIHELEAELARMRELVCEDQLTGSLNRRGLVSVLEHTLARVQRSRSPVSVALLDMDNFKKLNDTHGHAAGDAALVHLVRIAKHTLREMDVVGRFGGEEFLIVLPDTALEDAVRAIERVQAALHRHVFLYGGASVPLTFSAGVILCRAGDDQAAVVRRADKALYQAKDAGKNRVSSAG
jgi:diguanylate cyclase